ncbi:hypothetical protein NJ75_04385 [Novosphingobium subterraneum]|uniref:Uncharacterized protein n=1 Tax=Novosphingobium subterraneum TaxID=48936 RepID=A0A0B8Z748_9SPHN|nr:hypothetical protein NJ75_04385 [Novosphingobium subterraneum]
MTCALEVYAGRHMALACQECGSALSGNLCVQQRLPDKRHDRRACAISAGAARSGVSNHSCLVVVLAMPTRFPALVVRKAANSKIRAKGR